MRIVSLLLPATETVYALGLRNDLVGVNFDCDDPASVRTEKTVVVGVKDTRRMSPGDVDAYVRTQLAAGQDLYTLRAGAVAALAPDVILTQDLCRVCALPSGQVEQALEFLGCRAGVVSLDPHSLDDVLGSILMVGQRTGSISQATDLVNRLRCRLVSVAGRVVRQPPRRVAVIEWVDPPFTAGHWVPDLISAAGGIPVAGRAGRRSVGTTWGVIATETPDVMLVAPCGFGLAAAIEQAHVVAPRFPNAEVWAIDADGLVVRPGPRLVDGVEAIASIIHPTVAAAAPNATARVA